MNENGHKLPGYEIFDPTENTALITLNPNYIQPKRLDSYLRSSFVNMPPDYAESIVSIIYNGIETYRIPVLFLGDVAENWSTNFIKENPVGSSSPIMSFANSANTQITISFEALSDYLPLGYSTFPVYIDTIRQMTKPKYMGNEVQSPKISVVLPGYTFSGVCDSVSISYSQVYGQNTYVHATINCTFTISTLNII